jgi:hypothetical protein
VATALSLVLLALPAGASARWFGSTLRATPNADYGCESATSRPTFIAPAPGGSPGSG